MGEDQVVVYLLNGMLLSEFIALYIIAMGGAFSYFIVKLLFIFVTPPKSPVPKWDSKKFWVGVARLIATGFILPWWILYFEDLMPIVLDLFLDFPEVADETVKSVMVEMNGASALLSGFGFDIIVRKAMKKFAK